MYRDPFRVIASTGERHTSSPDRAWFAIWEGHGLGTAHTHIAFLRPATKNAALATPSGCDYATRTDDATLP